MISYPAEAQPAAGSGRPRRAHLAVGWSEGRAGHTRDLDSLLSETFILIRLAKTFMLRIWVS